MSIPPNSSLTNDIHSIALIILVNIHIAQERYGEALDNAIINIERIKELCLKKDNDDFAGEIMSRAYFILGFCYYKLSDQTPKYEDKVQSLQLGIATIKDVVRVILIYIAK